MAGLLSDVPSCYLYDSGSKSFSLNPDYERNGRKRSERYFAFVFFDGLEFPSQSSLAWVHIDHFEEWDKEKAKKIEHSQQAINYIKEEAKSQNRQYGSDDKIPDSEANNGLFLGFPVRLPSRNLQPRSNEGDLEIMLKTQEKPEVSIGQAKPTSLQYSNGKAGKRPTRVTPRRNLHSMSLRHHSTIHGTESHSQVDPENEDVADIDEEDQYGSQNMNERHKAHGRCQCKGGCDSGCSNLYALISCDNETCNVNKSACKNRQTLEGEGCLAKRLTEAYGMELYLDGDDIQEGAKLARYSGSPIPGDDLRRLRKETDDHIIKGHYVVQRKYSDLFVDAEHEDIIAKYANHSCQPNCELQEWLGSRGPILFLVASEPIERGDPITFKYNPKEAPTSVRVRFNEQVHDQGICYCASPSCQWTPPEAVQGVLDWIEKKDQCPNRMEANPQTIRITLPRNPTLIHYTLNSRLSIKDQLLHLRRQLEDKLLILE
ncbi:uncharacterized protein FMAN_14136 [Fusarium mangiferae]|uniref:SET domain-containing protein n=1 Tax=Fusarium mangiferae TaxID=192010 RepID=A0A1L7UJL0_FUSMA|nr:uncharacterized protein FMAN_14136 [Fusarium mangiferae]CVL08245.1 uncharacterized protein FMAN_14136 [Fusarium mangiferae]